MKRLFLAMLLAAGICPAEASTKTLTVLGDKKVKTKWDGDMPKAMSSRGIETNVTGIMLSGTELIPTFGFDISAKKRLLKVVVEDVTGMDAILMVTDPTPVVEDSHWKGDSAPQQVSPTGTPWLYAPGDTLTVYRFTILLEGDNEPIVIYQPSVFREASKARLRNFVTQLRTGH